MILILVLCFFLFSGVWSGSHSEEAFNTRLLKKLGQSQENFVFSPFIIDLALCVAALGAKNVTQKEIYSTLGYSGYQAQDRIAKQLKKISDVQADHNRWVSVQMANALLINSNFDIKKTYIADVNSSYPNSTIQTIDFQSTTETVNFVNKWVSEKTQQVINQLLEPSDIDSNVMMLIVNAIFFNGDWKYRFPEERTKEECFYSVPENCTLTEMMNNKGIFKFGYIEHLNAHFIELPYKNELFSMIVILPKIGWSLQNMTEFLNVDDILKQVALTEPVQVFVDLPKFSITFQKDMTDVLKELGIKEAFIPYVADFSGISSRNINLSKIVHKAKITCNEEGTEAAAATRISVKLRSTRLIEDFQANRPFLFLLRFDQDILFAGQIINF